jgi:hypothetical protein
MGSFGEFLAAALLAFLQQLSAMLGSSSPVPLTGVGPATATLTRRPTAVFTTTATRPPTRTPTLTATPSNTRRPTLTATATLTRRPTLTPTSTFTPRPTRTPSTTPTVTSTRTQTGTRTQSGTPTSTRTRRPTSTPTPTIDPATIPTPTTVPGLTSIGLAVATGTGPAQKLPSALLVYPLIESDAAGLPRDTRIEIVNLTGSAVLVHCVFIDSVSCNETDFGFSLTANQPVSWMASQGYRPFLISAAAPPFVGSGELKCNVEPRNADLNSHNALQGRALVSRSSSPAETVGYTAIGFRRLTPGDFGGTFHLDGEEYEQCPDRLHFSVLATSAVGLADADSELILVPCTENVLFGGTTTNVTLKMINEFEETLSANAALDCTLRKRFSKISTLRRSNLGTDTAHLVVRGVDVPVIGLVIDRFDALGSRSVSANEPYLEGGRSAVVQLP